jgi:hypothetical protein
MKKALIVFNFLLGISLCQGQIQKGTYQIETTLNHNKYFYKPFDILTLPSSPDFGNLGTFYVLDRATNLTPSYNYFATKNIRVGASLGFMGQAFKNDFKVGNSFFTRNYYVNPTIAYFFKPNAEWKFYINADYKGEFYTSITKGAIAKEKYNSNTFGLGIGFFRLLNENILLNCSTAFNYSPEISDEYGQFHRHLVFNLGIENLINNKTKINSGDQLLNKNRYVLNANIYGNLFNKLLSSKVNFGFMPLKNMLLGVNFEHYISWRSKYDFDPPMQISPYLQYYFPLNQKESFFANAKLLVLTDKHNKIITIEPSIGYNKFLTKYIALEVNVKLGTQSPLQYQPYYNNVFIGSNLRYFLK